jgi:hypothetical protein
VPKHEAEDLEHTIDLDLKPFESSSREFLLRSPVLEGITDKNLREVLQDSTLHCQFV